MSSRRVLKAAEAIREVVSMAILTDLRDPRIEGVTVTYVEVSPDMRQAKVHVSIMGDETHQKLCLHGLRSSAGFLQSKLSERIDTRYTPRLQFHLDEGVKKSLAISQMLKELLPDDQTGAETEPSEEEAE
jgi:ribosome-binding factor A